MGCVNTDRLKKIKTPNWESRQTAMVTRGSVTATGLSYFGARYLDPKTSRWTSADPALGEYIPGAPVNDEVKKRNGNLPGMGGVFNVVNLHVYHYAGNNPVKYVDPDGERMTFVQFGRLREYSQTMSMDRNYARIIRENTKIVITRNVYVGINIDGARYYKDNLSIEILGREINNIQVQSTVDWTNRYSESEAPGNYNLYSATIGVSGATNELIRDTILIERDNFIHRAKEENGRPFSGGCTITRTSQDEREVMNILRNYLGFENGDSIEVYITENHHFLHPVKDNIE
jgi:hypothetical protein